MLLNYWMNLIVFSSLVNQPQLTDSSWPNYKRKMLRSISKIPQPLNLFISLNVFDLRPNYYHQTHLLYSDDDFFTRPFFIFSRYFPTSDRNSPFFFIISIHICLQNISLLFSIFRMSAIIVDNSALPFISKHPQSS